MTQHFIILGVARSHTSITNIKKKKKESIWLVGDGAFPVIYSGLPPSINQQLQCGLQLHLAGVIVNKLFDHFRKEGYFMLSAKVSLRCVAF